MIAPNAPQRLVAPLVVVIPGEPKAQGRGRAVRFGSSVRVIDPESSRSWKGVAAVFMQQARNAAGVFAPLDVALVVEVDAYWPRPKSLKKSAPTGDLPRTSRPDADNVGKAVLDAGNGVLWSDDSLVTRLVVNKWVHQMHGAPRVEVRVEEWAARAATGGGDA